MKNMAAILSAGFILLFFSTGCEQRIQPSVIEGLDNVELPDQESWESTIIISDNGIKSAIVKAGYIAVYSEKERTYLEQGVKVDFFDEEGHISSVLVSERGIVYDDSHNLSGFGSVVIEGEDKTVLETEEIHWDNEGGRIHTDVFVRITSPSEIIQGYGFESDVSLSNYVIYRVTGETRPEPVRK